jgi:hypothetical protein
VGIGDLDAAHNLAGVDVCEAGGLVNIGLRGDGIHPTRFGIVVLSHEAKCDCVWIGVAIVKAQASSSRRVDCLKTCIRADGTEAESLSARTWIGRERGGVE